MSIIKDSCLKREREEPHPIRKRLRIKRRKPKIPVKEESLLIAGSQYEESGLFDAAYDDTNWEMAELVSDEKQTTRRSKKQPKTEFKNLFWGSQQQAWMGSVRVRGTIVRSCSRKSDLLAAKILNTRCLEKSLTPPNPSAGFLTSDELKQHTQVRSKKKTKTATQSRSSPFKNIFWGNQQQAWMGNIRVRGTIVRSCSRKSDVQAAKILNSRCLLKGITPPNPDVGFLDDKSANKYLEKQKKRRVRSSGQYIADDENYHPNETYVPPVKKNFVPMVKKTEPKSFSIKKNFIPMVKKVKPKIEKFDPIDPIVSSTKKLSLNLSFDDDFENINPVSQEFDYNKYSIRSPLERFDLPTPPCISGDFFKNSFMLNLSDLLPLTPQENNSFYFGQDPIARITSPSMLLY